MRTVDRARAGQGRGGARHILALLAVFAVTACAGSAAPNYDLTAPAPSPIAATAPRTGAKLHLRDPRVSDNLDSDRILVRSASGYAVLAGAKWKERLPELLRERLASALSGGAGFTIVDASAPADLNLEMQVSRFELDAEHRQAEIELTIKLVSAKTGRLAATRDFSAHDALESTAPPVVIATLDRAYSRLLLDIAAFAASR